MIEEKSILTAIQTAQKEHSLSNTLDLLIECFKTELMDKNDENLINMVFSSETSQEKFNQLLNEFDIENSDNSRLLILYYFTKLHPELNCPQNIALKLKSIANTYKLRNLKLISHYTKICKEFQKRDVDVMIFKGGVMKHLRPELSRTMGDIDVLVKENVYKKAGHIAEQMGYDCSWDVHSIDLHPKNSEEGIMDIHKYIDMNTGFERTVNDSFFSRAKKEKVFCIDTYVPSFEDLLFITLVNMVRNLTFKTSWQGVLFTLFDIKYLIEAKKDFNWEIVIDNARRTKTEIQIYFVTKLINKIVPGLLPEKIPSNTLSNKEVDNYCTILLYQRFFLWNMKQKGHDLKMQDIFTDISKFKEYLKLKPKYFILKWSIFRKNPIFAKLILKINAKYPIAK